MHSTLATPLSHSTIYLMGMSFVLGSLVTILILLALDFVRLSRAGEFSKRGNVDTGVDEGDSHADE